MILVSFITSRPSKSLYSLLVKVYVIKRGKSWREEINCNQKFADLCIEPIKARQSSMFSSLANAIDQGHPLTMLADKIEWQ